MNDIRMILTTIAVPLVFSITFSPEALGFGKKPPKPPSRQELQKLRQAWQGPQAEQLYAGFAEGDITPPVGVPLAGFGGGDRRMFPDFFQKHPYSFYLKPSEGILDPIKARVMYLTKGDQRLLFIGLDLVGVTKHLRDDITRDLQFFFGFYDHEVYISGTHTHSGPGTVSKNLIWQLIAADRFKRSIYRRLIQSIVSVSERAVFSRTEADLHFSHFQASGLTKNRRTDNTDVDSEANILYARSSNGSLLGGLVNFAIHGTSLKDENLHYSGDVPGAIADSMAEMMKNENNGAGPLPVAVFFNGAEGDVTPFRSGLENMKWIGHSFAEIAREHLPETREISPNWRVKSKRIRIGSPALRLKGCLEDKGLFSTLFKGMRVGLPLWFPKKARLWSIQFDNLALMTWPGEPTTEVGRELKAVAKERGFEFPIILGLTNHHLAYFTTQQEYERGGYEACSSLYGYRAAGRIIRAHNALFGD